ncbi:MAG: NAD-dependent dehydratase [Chloroflexi bacterium RBG_16_56_11]|nr:MAG: NAD-dependent dehydratase [Chloroflexi bacterium RBG_16_56_11]
MNVLITGNNGYIGSILTRVLLDRGYQVTGFDTGYYRGCEFDSYAYPQVKQIHKDIRKMTKDDLKGVDAVIHLAALSNDPLGAFDTRLTEDINFLATVRLAEIAKGMGIRRFIYASSCSLYGIAGEEAVTENSPLAPVTEYAISKVKSEEALTRMVDDTFSPVFLRASTVYGIAPMLRCDLVVNNLVGWAYTTGKIRIMSDGTPWRPTIHIEDLSQAYLACLECPIDMVHNQAFNVGQNKENYQIRDMANIAKKIIPGCEVEYTYEHGSDSRTYKVSFDKIFARLGQYYQPAWDVEKGMRQLYQAYKNHGLTLEEFIGNKYIRINQLKSLVTQKAISESLFWRN